MNKFMKLSIITAVLLTGCTTTQERIRDFNHRHPVASSFIWGSIWLSAGYALSRELTSGPTGPSNQPQMSKPLTPNCSVYPELCK